MFLCCTGPDPVGPRGHVYVAPSKGWLARRSAVIMFLGNPDSSQQSAELYGVVCALRERDSQVADLSVKNCNLGPKTAIFGPKKPWSTFKTAKQRETVGTLHVRLDFPLSTSSLRPSNSMICTGKRPKKAPEAPNADGHKPRIAHIFGYMAQNAIPRAPTPPATPHFLWFPALRIAQTDA